MSAQAAAAPVGEMKASLIVDGLIIPVVEKELPIGTKLYAAPPASVAAPEPVAWGCFYPDGAMLNVDLVGTEKDCRFWAESEDRQAAWIPRPLYAAPPAERVALLEEALKTIELDARVARPYVGQVKRLGDIARAALEGK